jgi:hypothetical protein
MEKLANDREFETCLVLVPSCLKRADKSTPDVPSPDIGLRRRIEFVPAAPPCWFFAIS